MIDQSMQVFRNEQSAIYLDRPNRFVIQAELLGEKTEIYCPNPGRLQELLFPGTELILEKIPNPKAKYRYSLAAIKRENTYVPMNTHRANDLYEQYLMNNGILKRHIQREYSIGNHRIDFLVEHQSHYELIEIKSCSLVEAGIAMFPDAPSERANSHLRLLSRLISGNKDLGNKSSGNGKELDLKKPLVSKLVFIINHSAPHFFMANYHSDLALLETMVKTKDDVTFEALAYSCDSKGKAVFYKDQVQVILPKNLEYFRNGTEWEISLTLDHPALSSQKRYLNVHFARKNRNTIRSKLKKQGFVFTKKVRPIDLLTDQKEMQKLWNGANEQFSETSSPFSPLQHDSQKMMELIKILDHCGIKNNQIFLSDHNLYENRDFIDNIYQYRHSAFREALKIPNL